MVKFKKCINIPICWILKIREFLKLINYSNFGKSANFPNYKFLEFEKLEILEIS